MRVHAFFKSLPFTADPYQVLAAEMVEMGRSVVVTAPTGAGKTLIAEAAIHLSLANRRRVFYTTPLKALSNQKSYSPRGKGTVESCTLCVHRVDRNRTPACVEACQSDGGGAMVFGDLNDESGVLAGALRDHPSSQVRRDLDLNTGVRYRNL